ncbi:MAG TPA: DUF1707 domain-containing protein [Streptosporangiaceae bacterium]|nr:DUF1707 domain-containing protein [Streptosporangiaceae bacterium]
MSTDDAIRASDADREHAVGILRDGYVSGRLTLPEFDERLAAAFTSRTWGELRGLTRDLPTAGQRGFLPPVPPRPRVPRADSERLPPAAIASGGPKLTPVLLIALFWLTLTFAAHAGGALIPVVFLLLMAVRSAARVRGSVSSTSANRLPPEPGQPGTDPGHDPRAPYAPHVPHAPGGDGAP